MPTETLPTLPPATPAATPAPAAPSVPAVSSTPPPVAAPATPPPDAPVFDTKSIDPSGEMTLEQLLDAKIKAGDFDDDKLSVKIPKGLHPMPTPPKPAGPEATTPPDAAKVFEAATTPVSAEATDDQLNAEIADATKGMGEKERKGFAKVRYELRETQRKLKEMASLKTELDAIKAAPPKVDDAAVQAVQKKVEELQAKIAEKEDIILASKAEHSEHFQQHFGQPLAEIDSRLSVAAKEYSIEASDIDRAMALTGKERANALSELAAEMPDFDRKDFYDLLTRRAELLVKRTDFMSKAAENFKAMEQRKAESAQQERAARDSQWKQTAEKQWSDTVAKELPALSKTDDETVKSVREFALNTSWDRLSITDQATALHRAAAWPVAIQTISGMEAKIAQLEKQLGDYKTATPSAGAGSPAPNVVRDGNGVPAEASFEEALSIRMRQAGMR